MEGECHTTMAQDLWLVENILKRLDHGDDFPSLHSLRRQLTDIRAKLLDGAAQFGNDAPAPADLGRILRATRGAATEAKIVFATEVLAFVHEQIEHFSEIRAQRPLTDEEKRFGREDLMELTHGLKELLGSPERGQNSEGQEL